MSDDLDDIIQASTTHVNNIMNANDNQKIINKSKPILNK